MDPSIVRDMSPETYTEEMVELVLQYKQHLIDECTSCSKPRHLSCFEKEDCGCAHLRYYENIDDEREAIGKWLDSQVVAQPSEGE